MAISKFTPQSAKKDTGRTIGDNEVAKLANLNKIVTEVNTIFGGTANELLAANGSSVSAGQNITISNGTISASGGGGGSSTFDMIVTGGTISSNVTVVSYSTRAFVPTTGGSIDVLTYPSLNLYGNGATCTGITFPTITFIEIGLSSMANLVQVNFPALTQIRSGGMGSTLNISNCPALTTLTFPALNYLDSNTSYNFNANAFSQATVDAILVKFASITSATNSILALNGGTSAAPSATGLAAKATLQGRGWNVSTN